MNARMWTRQCVSSLFYVITFKDLYFLFWDFKTWMSKRCLGYKRKSACFLIFFFKYHCIYNLDGSKFVQRIFKKKFWKTRKILVIFFSIFLLSWNSLDKIWNFPLQNVTSYCYRARIYLKKSGQLFRLLRIFVKFLRRLSRIIRNPDFEFSVENFSLTFSE
jgi:hypothetical protein